MIIISLQVAGLTYEFTHDMGKLFLVLFISTCVKRKAHHTRQSRKLLFNPDEKRKLPKPVECYIDIKWSHFKFVLCTKMALI